MIKRTLLLLLTGALLCSCATTVNIEPTGVSYELANHRKATIQEPTYDLTLNIPQSIDSLCSGVVDVQFRIDQAQPITLDFKAPKEYIHSVAVNGKACGYQFVNEHIVVDGAQGHNSIKIRFTAPDHSLNRRQEFLYTLLVPDRARTFFPCFDQPNLKAKFTLTLTTPSHWKAVSNGKVLRTQGNTTYFSQTEPLSTYLFSVVAGELECVTQSRAGRAISLYHRETDPLKVAQINTIFDQVYASLAWLEAYTAIDYPFAKYDLIILPGFQYGGMEHTGATLYSDRTMFLNPAPTIKEELMRCNLIAHETAHMWFGDYVTMDWFSDVWTKEVMANYFAALITEPLFPAVDHQLNFMLSNAIPAYGEDRTAGANPIQQELYNLQDAGLVYGNTIYTKSPIVISMLVKMIGREPFQKGIRDYLTTYAYGNATWDNLIAILDKQSPIDLQSWSDAWVKERGMPQIETTPSQITQSDPLNRGVVWSQQIALLSGDSTVYVTLDSTSVANPFNTPNTIPNSDGLGYGYFKLDSATTRYAMQQIAQIKSGVTRGSILITLHENFLRHNLDGVAYLEFLIDHLGKEQNQLLYAQAIHYAQTALLYSNARENQSLERLLFQHAKKSITALRAYAHIVRSEEGVEKLYALWSGENSLSIHDAITISYQLAIRLPKQAEQIVARQKASIKSSDIQKQYAFICPAVSPDPATRDSLFNALLRAENRSIEPWAQTALSLLNHPLRADYAVKYIRPALDKVAEIQKTGDIFFPSAWCGALLSGHHSQEAKEEVAAFFRANEAYPKKLGDKIWQQAHHLDL